MIRALEPASPRRVHVDGLPILTATGKALGDTDVPVFSFADLESWAGWARSLRGQFAVIVAEGSSAIIVTDLAGCYPAFYLTGPAGTARKIATSLIELENDSSRSVRRTALFEYVAFRSMDLDGETIYKDIDRASGGSVTFYSRDRIETREYARWESLIQCGDQDMDAAEQQLESLIRTYTDANMPQGGEPLGILLSGGTDSTLLASLLKDEWKGRLRFFTQHFSFRRYSELSQAEENARTLGIETRAVMLRRSNHLRAVRALNSRECDQPCVTLQAFNLWSLIHSVSKDCRFFMLGEHADSLFLGFGHFFSGLPSDTDSYLAATHALAPERKLDWVLPRVGISDLDAELLDALDLSREEYLEWLGDFARRRAGRFAPFRNRHLTTLQQLDGQIDGGLGWQRIVLPVLKSLAGVKILTPFFDPAMIAFALSLPVTLKYRDGKTKFLLREVLRKHIGRELRKAPAAASPVAIWRIPASFKERAAISPVLRPYYDRLMKRNLFSLGRMVNHQVKVAALGLWMHGRGL
jgi:hypothetical protein